MAQFNQYSSSQEPGDSWLTLFSDGSALKNVSLQDLHNRIESKLNIDQLVSDELDSLGIDTTAREEVIPLISANGSNVSYNGNFTINTSTTWQSIYSPSTDELILPYMFMLYWNKPSGLAGDATQNLKINIRAGDSSTKLYYIANPNTPTDLVDGGSQWIDIDSWLNGYKYVQWFYGNRKGNENEGVQFFTNMGMMLRSSDSLDIKCDQGINYSGFESDLLNQTNTELVLRMKYYKYSVTNIGI